MEHINFFKRVKKIYKFQNSKKKKSKKNPCLYPDYPCQFPGHPCLNPFQ